jgi:hypothetical protein
MNEWELTEISTFKVDSLNTPDGKYSISKYLIGNYANGISFYISIIIVMYVTSELHISFSNIINIRNNHNNKLF